MLMCVSEYINKEIYIQPKIKYINKERYIQTKIKYINKERYKRHTDGRLRKPNS